VDEADGCMSRRAGHCDLVSTVAGGDNVGVNHSHRIAWLALESLQCAKGLHHE
jgi:hypothetical protein